MESEFLQSKPSKASQPRGAHFWQWAHPRPAPIRARLTIRAGHSTDWGRSRRSTHLHPGTPLPEQKKLAAHGFAPWPLPQHRRYAAGLPRSAARENENATNLHFRLRLHLSFQESKGVSGLCNNRNISVYLGLNQPGTILSSPLKAEKDRPKSFTQKTWLPA